MSWTAGLTIGEIESQAREMLPASITVQIEEGPEPSQLSLILKDEAGEPLLQSLILKSVAIPDPTPEFTEAIKKRTLEQLERTINEYKRGRVRRTIEEFGLDEYLRNEYADKNFIYKVPRRYTTERRPGFTFTKNLDLHYLDRVREMAPHFASFWEYLVMNDSSHPNRSVVLEYGHGLAVRLGELAFSVDIIKELDSLKPDNDVQFLVNYHLSHFISVAKSIGDNLAWLLKEFYAIEVDDEKKVGLLSKGFLRKLELKDAHLYARLAGQPQLGAYTNLKLFRDVVQHRHALHVVHVLMVSTKEERLMVPFNPASGAFGRFDFPTISRAQDKRSIASFGLKELVIRVGPPETPGYERLGSFCDRHVAAVSHLCDQVFFRLNQLLRRKHVGEVYDYLKRLSVALVLLTTDLSLGQRLLFEGKSTLIEQSLGSMQVDRLSVQKGKTGQKVGILTVARVRVGDQVYSMES